MVAYGELTAFDRMAADARLAPDLRRPATIREMAAVEIANYRRRVARRVALGADPEAAMAPYVDALQAYHDSTEPRNWLEALTKAYVGDGVADDFFREVAALVEEPDRQLVLDVVHGNRYEEFAAAAIRAAIAADPKVANRLSMWARRLVGEALSQATRVAGTRPALLAMIAENAGDQGAPPALFKRMTVAHGTRMAHVGLNN